MLEESEKRFYVYVYRDLGGVPIYVGKGTELRYREHYKNGRNYPINTKLRKIRDTFGYMVYPQISDLMSEKDSHYLEMCLIEAFGRKDLGLGTLLNLTNGGEGSSGRVASPELREKLRSASTGAVFSEETRKKMSEARKGRSVSEKTRLSTIQRNKDRVWTDEAREKARNRDLSHLNSVESNAKKSAAKKGKPLSDLAYQKSKERWALEGMTEKHRLAVSASQSIRVCCLYCKTEGKAFILKRLHLDNCKFKI